MSSRTLRVYGILISFLLINILPGNIFGQTRCNLVSEQCIDLTGSATGGDPIVVPSNTTRFTSEAVSICLTPEGTETPPVDIMFVVDQSGSMAWNDVTYYAPIATRNSLDILDDLTDNSTVGLVDFGSQVCSDHGLVNVETSKSIIQGWIESELADGTDPSIQNPTKYYPDDGTPNGNNSSSQYYKYFHGTEGLGCAPNSNLGTNYNLSLSAANTRLEAGTNSKQAIIFITDGEPSNEDLFDNWDGKEDLYPVFSIFIGGDSTSEGGQRLINLAQLTGGGYFTVPENDPVALNTVLAAVVTEVVSPAIPHYTSIENTTMSQISSADSTEHSQLGNGLYRVELNNIVGIQQGSNSIVVKSVSTINGVLQDTVSFEMTIAATGEPYPNLGSPDPSVVPDELFDITCVGPSTLTATNAAFVPIDTILQTATQVGMELLTPSGVLDPIISVTSPLSIENESLVIPFTGIDSLYRKVSPFSVVAGPATQGDLAIQGQRNDLLYFKWVHPRDPGDSAVDTLVVDPFPSDTTAKIWLSTSAAVSASTSSFAEASTPVYVIVKDQLPYLPGLFTYTARIVTIGGDNVTINLAPDGNGYLVGQVSANYNPLDTGNGGLEINLGGDNLAASYKDPLYGETVQATAFYSGKSIAQPVADPPGGEFFKDDTSVTLSSATAGAQIHYTDDGSIPNQTDGTDYSGAINISSSTTIKAVAFIFYNANNYAVSTMLSANYIERGTTPTPSAVPPTTYFTEDTTVTLVPGQDGDSIYYSTSGIPTRADVLFSDSSPILITGTTTLRFFAVNGTDNPSPIITEVYTKRDTLPVPVLTPATTSFYEDTTVTMTHSETGARIFYTLDKSEPLSDDNLYVSSNKPVTTLPTTIKARAYPPIGSDAWIQSPVVTEVYSPTVGTPVAVPGDTAFVSELLSYLFTSTFGAAIHYTKDGSTPDTTDPVYTQPLLFTGPGTLKAIAVKPLWANSAVLEVAYTKTPANSTLEILGVNLNPMDYLTELNTSFVVRVTAPEPNLTEIHPEAYTLTNGDTTALTLTATGRYRDQYRFRGTIPFSVSKAKTGNNTVQAAPFDSVFVRWVNENDTRDTASDIIWVRPYPRNPIVYFTEKSGEAGVGKPVTQYQSDRDTAYVVIQDQIGHPDLDYDVTLTTRTLYGVEPDTLILPLIEFAPGTFGVAVPLELTETKDPGDKTLQVLPGDIIQANYTDPLDGESGEGRVKFGEPGEVPGEVNFTDSAGSILADGKQWSPDRDSLYITYVDDYMEYPKTATIFVKNTNGQGVVTYDTLTNIDLGSPVKDDSIGTWTAAVPMDEVPDPDPGNGIVEIFFKGEVTVQVTTHSKSFAPLKNVEDRLIVAHPNEDANIEITDNTGGFVVRLTQEVKIEIDDQDFTGLPDTIFVDVASDGTQDVIQKVRLIEDENGNYVGTFTKVEGPGKNKEDNLLTKPSDCIVVTYADPVYPDDIITKKACYIYDRASSVSFATEAVGSTAAGLDDYEVITNLDEFGRSDFVVVVTAPSITQDKRDTLEVVITADNGDKITVQVIETDVFSGIYESEKVSFGFTPNSPGKNQHLEGTLDLDSAVNTMEITAVISNTNVSNSLEIEAAYVPIDSVQIFDGDDNGAGDTIRVFFREPLRALPEEITSIDWPREGVEGYSARTSKKEIFFLENKDGTIDSSVVLIVLKEGGEPLEFDVGQTSPHSSNPGRITLPDNPVFQGQTPVIEDRMGAIVTEAVLSTSGTKTYKNPDGDKRFHPDTVVVTLSEPITMDDETLENWNKVFRFTPTNSDSSYPLIMLTPPLKLDDQTYQIIITNEPGIRTPNLEHEIFLAGDAPVVDGNDNTPSEAPKDIEGENPVKAVYTVGVLNPIEGVESGTRQFYASHRVDEEGNPIVTTADVNAGADQMWLPPLGFDSRTGKVDQKVRKRLCGQNYGQNLEYEKYAGQDCRQMSSVLVCSEEAYKAQVQIFDNHGKFINSDKVSWGYCGEKENENSYGTPACPKGGLSYIFWNQEDVEGNLVGSGMYLYKILFDYEDSDDVVKFEKQGIIRREKFSGDCAPIQGD